MLRWYEFEIQSVKGKSCLAFMCQNLKTLSQILSLFSHAFSCMVQWLGEIFFLSAVVLIQTLKYIHLKICISPFPPSGYERKELRSYLVCSFPQRWDLQYYAKHKFLKCWLSSWEARSGFKWQGVVSKSLFFPFGRYVLVFRQNVEKWSHLG